MMSHIYGVWKIIQMNLFIKQKWTHRHMKKKNYGYQRESGGGGMN